MKRMIILIAAMVFALAACGGSDDTGVASLEESTTTQAPSADGAAGDSLDEEALLEFSACMRENGVEDFEDPVVNADGTIEFGAVGGEGVEIPSDAEIEELEAAFEVCADELAGVAFGGDGAFDITEFQDSFVEFAACMRDNGVELDDPDFNAPGGIIDVFGDIDITDPKIQEALEQCQDIFADFAPGGTG